MPAEPLPLLVLGASTRSAAHSAIRAGFRPICADTFTDEDLQSAADILPLQPDEYPDDLIRCAKLAPPCPWMYTGALENYPQIVHTISRTRPLWGNSVDVLRSIRDPVSVHSILSSAGLPVPKVRAASAPPAPDGTWMIKPIRSGGGRGIHIWNEHTLHCATLKEPHWFQKRIQGESLAALFIMAAGKSTLVGVTHQRVGTKGAHGPAHGYCGSLGPLLLNASDRQQVSRVGDILAGVVPLQGICGIDGIWNNEGFWPVDINPRYTASVEIVEHALGLPLIAWHANSCDSELSQSVCDQLQDSLPKRPLCFGAKAILFAREPVVVPNLARLIPAGMESPLCRPVIADRPTPGSKIATGQPICSVFGWGSSESECESELAKWVKEVEGTIYPMNHDFSGSS